MIKGFMKASLLFSVLLFLVTGAPATDHFSLAEEPGALQTITLKIDGMDCGACAKEIRSALMERPGVRTAEVKVRKKWLFFDDFSDARAVVEYEQSKTTVDDLIKAVEGASNSMFTYHARLIE
ncbi:heavy-metal-associated domain-containing protein [Candidatus Manganitrophus noduliformans]|uniref:Heavy-metal-associated domain-containing protein n=1 Tax=Candidatus Manganitrophus noduliformans TaxID=2606439 RepID=A0A7X6DN93_9BACT|nr:heavy metal-associated domain-containing protein [Candidatus Manganitrophus noduliformans]NKE70234.1 heavy-metal-associated domain-containing protein [Candidatus Manganitrophus noduliformans]